MDCSADIDESNSGTLQVPFSRASAQRRNHDGVQLDSLVMLLEE
jgi:hypothetical protein